MWTQLTKKKLSKDLLKYNSRIHIDHPAASSIFQANLDLFITQLYDQTTQLIILCIGTDRSTGDSLGPLVGSKLKAMDCMENVPIYGTLDEPVHAVNLPKNIKTITDEYPNSFILAVDACLGRTESVGYISIKEGPLQPGTGVNKSLPAIGDLHIVGIVNVGGFMEYMVLQNTRLSLVMKMAEIISEGIANEVLNNLQIRLPQFTSPSETPCLETTNQ
ncbi:MAG: spore protease YyaC [Firmicutes bacterium]|nr:spore protease YyaC [Bacillota bacterium]